MTTGPMKAIELIGDIDEEHRLQARVPEDLPIGPVRLIVLLPDEIRWALRGPRASPPRGRKNCKTHGRTSTHSKTGSR
jgi:hypothetical protein